MKKTTAIITIIAALLVGVAVTVYAQVVYVTLAVKYENTTPVLGAATQYGVILRTVATAKGVDVTPLNGTQRRMLVASQMKECFEGWLVQQIAGEEQATAQANTAARIAALRGTAE